MIVVDEDGCVLLVRIVDDLDDKPPVWITPGGSLERGESLAEAASRELFEETGRLVAPEQLGRPIAVSRGDWIYRGTPLRSEDWFFGLRVGRFEPDIEGYTALEREVHDSWRWWPPDELESPGEIVVPRGLHDIAGRIAAGYEPEDSPVVLPWTDITVSPTDRGSSSR